MMTFEERIRWLVQVAIKSFDNDPAESNFQQGYLAALKWLQREIDDPQHTYTENSARHADRTRLT